jgi:hypothetical protein
MTEKSTVSIRGSVKVYPKHKPAGIAIIDECEGRESFKSDS